MSDHCDLCATARLIWEEGASGVQREWDGGIEGPDVDLFVSESDAAHRQRAVDARLGEMWGGVA